MQLDVDIEPTLRFPGMTSIEKEMDLSESKLSIYLICISTTDRQKAMHKSPLCNLHRWAQKGMMVALLSCHYRAVDPHHLGASHFQQATHHGFVITLL